MKGRRDLEQDNNKQRVFLGSLLIFLPTFVVIFKCFIPRLHLHRVFLHRSSSSPVLIARLPSSRTHSILLHCLSLSLHRALQVHCIVSAFPFVYSCFPGLILYSLLIAPLLALNSHNSSLSVAYSRINPPCIANMNSHWQTLLALLFPLLFVPTPTTSPAQCSGKFTHKYILHCST